MEVKKKQINEGTVRKRKILKNMLKFCGSKTRDGIVEQSLYIEVLLHRPNSQGRSQRVKGLCPAAESTVPLLILTV